MTPEISPLIQQAAAALTSGTRQIILTGLNGSAPSYVVSRLLTEVPDLFLILTPDNESAEEFCRELRFYTGAPGKVLLFPPWETTPFDRASPHPDTSGERLATLFRAMDGTARAVVVPVSAAAQKVLPRMVLGDVSQYLVTGEETDREALLAKLVKLGYSSVTLVEDRSTFSIRGGILDIFPSTMPQPVRSIFRRFRRNHAHFDRYPTPLEPLPELILLPSGGDLFR